MGKKTKWILAALAAVMLSCAACRKAPEPSPAPTSTPAVTPAPTLSPEERDRGLGQVVISEFMEKNRAVLRDEDGDFSDWIELYNQSGEPVSLAGWTISDKENKAGWTLPEVRLEPGQRLLLFASGKDRAGQQLHTDFALAGDEGVYLRNEHGTSSPLPSAAIVRRMWPWLCAPTGALRKACTPRRALKTAGRATRLSSRA